MESFIGILTALLVAISIPVGLFGLLFNSDDGFGGLHIPSVRNTSVC